MGPVPAVDPAPPARIASFPVHVYSADTDRRISECGVCLEDYAQGDQYWELPTCRHHFHVACLRVWLESHSTCPFCRQTV
ncbi:unnamed protein product [Linum tenue]|uniref:RING-type E3 ubiquitin transferase n=1 Tax=Linum tenue TaxID=586396 RepID=A0AAV0GX65_9ROSI|nr:unnamed protein product [Linum tenue]